MFNECIVLLKRLNAIIVPEVETDFNDGEGDKELYEFLDRILKEQELRDQERERINELKENIYKNKIK